MDAFRVTRVQWTVGFLQLKGKRKECVFIGHVLLFLTKLPFPPVF